MAYCASGHKNSPGSAIKPPTQRSKLEIPASPVKDDVTQSPTANGSHSYIEEKVFLDSIPCLDSETEDDFFSVDGEFTPSHGNTPIHHSLLSSGNPRANEPVLEEPLPGLVSKAYPRKTLIELFKEPLDEDCDAQSEANTKVAERTVNRDSKAESEKRTGSVQGCIPRLVSCRSFTERRRKMSHGVAYL